MSAAMLAILLALGVWQVRRLAWKEAILAHIAAAERAPPIPLPAKPGPFVKVAVTGQFRPDLALHFGAEVRETAAGPTMGTELVAPLERADGPPVLVDRGWIPLSVPAPIAWPKGNVTVAGYVLAPEHPGWFTPAPEPRRRRVFALDPPAIGRMIGLSRVAPFTLIALSEAPSTGYPAPARHLPRPPNHHLVYAATWFSLAGAIAMIFGVWARDQVRGSDRS
ncbi:MAG: SURF1 family protein [Rhodospirillales bacterium]|nr:SURF1 family protein [Rhodospirillales bacterium]